MWRFKILRLAAFVMWIPSTGTYSDRGIIIKGLCKHSVGPRSWFLRIITNTDGNSLSFNVCNSTGLWQQNAQNTNTLKCQTAQKPNFLLHLQQTNYNKSTEWYLAAHIIIVSGYAPQRQLGKLWLVPHILISV